MGKICATLETSIRKDTQYTRLSKVIALLCAVCLLFIYAVAFVMDIRAQERLPLLLMMAAAYCVILYVLYTGIEYRLMQWPRGRKLAAICLIGAGIVAFQVILCSAVNRVIGWDVGAVRQIGCSISVGEPVSMDAINTYPNLTLLTLIFYWIYSAAPLFAWSAQACYLCALVVNILMVDLALAVTCAAAKKFFSRQTALLCFLLGIPLICFNLWITVPYTDTLGMLFPVLVFYLYVTGRQSASVRKKWICFALAGASAGFGYLLKPTVLIVLIALVLVELFWLRPKKEKIRRTFLTGGISALCLCIAFFAVTKGFSAYAMQVFDGYTDEQTIEETSFPMTHWMMMGLSHNENGSPGSYYGKDVAFTASVPGKEAKMQANLSVIKQRLEEYGVAGYLGFLKEKMHYVYTSGTFSFGAEGHFYESEPFADDEFARAVQSVVYPGGTGYPLYQNHMNALWIVVLALLAVSPLAVGKGRRDKRRAAIYLTLIGLTCYLMLFEARARYLTIYIPFLVLAAADSMLHLSKRIQDVIKYIHTKKARGKTGGAS